jgi:hypothetical protein
MRNICCAGCGESLNLIQNKDGSYSIAENANGSTVCQVISICNKHGVQSIFFHNNINCCPTCYRRPVVYDVRKKRYDLPGQTNVHEVSCRCLRCDGEPSLSSLPPQHIPISPSSKCNESSKCNITNILKNALKGLLFLLIIALCVVACIILI